MEPVQIDKEEESFDNDLQPRRHDHEDRMGFIRKVYGILSVQLCLTAAVITAVKTVPGWNDRMRTPAMGGLAMGLLVASIVVECAILCCKSVARKTPWNYVLLFIFTAC